MNSYPDRTSISDFLSVIYGFRQLDEVRLVASIRIVSLHLGKGADRVGVKGRGGGGYIAPNDFPKRHSFRVTVKLYPCRPREREGDLRDVACRFFILFLCFI